MAAGLLIDRGWRITEADADPGVPSLTTLAVERDRADPAGPVAGGRTAANANDGTVAQGSTDVLISAIPTEPLAASPHWSASRSARSTPPTPARICRSAGGASSASWS